MKVPVNIVAAIRRECTTYLQYKKFSNRLLFSNSSYDLVNNFSITLKNALDIDWNTLLALTASLVKDKKAFKERTSKTFDELITKIVSLIKQHNSTLQFDIIWHHQTIMQVYNRRDLKGKLNIFKDLASIVLNGKLIQLKNNNRLQKISHIIWLLSTTSIIKKLDSNGKFEHNNISYKVSNKKYKDQEITLFIVPEENKIYVTHETTVVEELHLDVMQNFKKLLSNEGQKGAILYILQNIVNDIGQIKQSNFVINLCNVLDHLPYEALKSTNHLYLFLFGSFREWLTSSFIPNAMASAFQYISQRPVGLMEQPSLSAQNFVNTGTVIKQLVSIIQNSLGITYSDVTKRIVWETQARYPRPTNLIEFD